MLQSGWSSPYNIRYYLTTTKTGVDVLSSYFCIMKKQNTRLFEVLDFEDFSGSQRMGHLWSYDSDAILCQLPSSLGCSRLYVEIGQSLCT